MTFQGLQVFSFRSFPLIITEIQCGQGCDCPHLMGGETDTQGDCRACLSPTAVVVDLHVDMGLSDSYGPTDARCAGHCPEFSRAEKPTTELWGRYTRTPNDCSARTHRSLVCVLGGKAVTGWTQDTAWKVA